MITEAVESLDNPFPGLRPFQFHENHLFFGREGLSEELLSRLSETRFLAVVGASGSGKSSLVRAGLLPALCGGLMSQAGSDWRVAVLRPGNDPIGELARVLNDASVLGGTIEDDEEAQRVITESTLRRGSLGLIDIVRQAMLPPGENLLIVVDQFEELFRYARNTPKPLPADKPYKDAPPSAPESKLSAGPSQPTNGQGLHYPAVEKYGNEAAAFVKLLLEATRQDEVPIFVVITMRSDYVGYCAQFWGLPEAINQGQYLIPRLTREQQRDAITGPVAVYGGEITPRLVSQLLNDIGDDPDQLPLLQHALMRTWKKAAGDSGRKTLLDLNDYLAVGGMAEALSKHADDAYHELSPGRRKIAEKLFKCLTVKRPEGQESRRPTALKDICEIIVEKEEAVIEVIEVFRRRGRSFLMPPASEPLASKSQIDISHESLIRCWGRLSAWVADEAESARIYRRLADTAVSYKAGRAGLLLDPEAHFTLEWYDKNRPNEAWAKRYHPADFAVVVVFLEESRVLRNRVLEAKEEQRRKKIWRKYKGILAATLSVALIVALILTYWLWQQADLLKQQAGQLWRQTEVANQRRNEAKHKSYIASMNLAQYAYDEQNYAEANRRLEDIRKEYVSENSKEYGPDNLLGFEWYYLRGVSSKYVRASLTESIAESDAKARAKSVYSVNSAKFSPDGSYIATGNADGTVKLLDAKTGRWLKSLPATLGRELGQVWSLAFSGDGRRIVVGGEDGSVTSWMPDTGEVVTLREKPAGERSARQPIYSVAFSHDGTLVAAGGAGKLVLWNIERPDDGKILSGTNNVDDVINAASEHETVRAVAFSPADKKLLAVGRDDGSLEIWNTGAGRIARTFEGEGQRPKSNGKPVAGPPVKSIDFSPDGRLLAVGLADSSVRLWDPSDNRTLVLPAHSKQVAAVAFYHPRQGSAHDLLATGSNDGSVRLWDTSASGWERLKSQETPRGPNDRGQLVTLKGHSDNINSVDFSPDRRTLVTGSADGTARLWDVESALRDGDDDNKETDAASLTVSPGVSLALSPDGKTLFGGDGRGKLSWGPAGSLGVMKEGALPNERPDENLCPISSVAVPSRQANVLAVGCWYSGEVRLWDISTGRRLLPSPPITPEYESYSIVSLALSPDGNTLAAGFSPLSPDGRRSPTDAHHFVQVWRRGNEFKQVKHLPDCDSVAFSPDGKLLATGCFENGVKLKLWDAETLESVGKPKIYSDGGVIFAFSPDSKILAAVVNNDLIELLDVRNLKKFGEQPSIKLKGQKDIISLAFSPTANGSRLASGSRDGTVVLWDTSEEMRYVRDESRNRDQSGIRILIRPASITSLVFSPDGDTLFNGGGNGEVKFWRAPRSPERP